MKNTEIECYMEVKEIFLIFTGLGYVILHKMTSIIVCMRIIILLL